MSIPRQWIRLYTSVLDDPKIQTLPDVLFRFWIDCLLLCGYSGDYLPTTSRCAFRLRITEKQVESRLAALASRGLIDETPNGFRMHDWEQYQYDSDSSTPRVKRFRNVARAVTETDRAEQSREEQNRAEQNARASGELSYEDFRRIDAEKRASRTASASASQNSSADALLPAAAESARGFLERVEPSDRPRVEQALREARERIESAHNPAGLAVTIIREVGRVRKKPSANADVPKDRVAEILKNL